MDDLGAMIGSIMSDPQKMEQLRSVAQSLGMPAPPANNAPPPQPSGQNNSGGGGGFDPAMLASILQGLGGMGGGAPQNTPPVNPQPQQSGSQGSGFDPGMLASILQGLGGMGAMGGNAAGGAASGGGINLGSISKISEIMNIYNQNDKNVDLLRTLKPHFSATRSGRIDDAIRIMQLMRAWPVLRDSGLLSGLGGLGNLFGGGGGR